jgi:hypothetical protein
VSTREHLEEGRQFYAMRAWRRAYESLSRADWAAPLAARDLELLATAAAMIEALPTPVRNLTLRLAGERIFRSNYRPLRDLP